MVKSRLEKVLPGYFCSSSNITSARSSEVWVVAVSTADALLLPELPFFSTK